MKNDAQNRKFRRTAIRNVLIVLVSLFALLGIAELVLFVQALFTGSGDNSNVVLMSYEKTPVSALLTTEENYVYARRFFSDPADYDKFVQDEAPGALAYPYIDNLQTTADYNEDTVDILVLGIPSYGGRPPSTATNSSGGRRSRCCGQRAITCGCGPSPRRAPPATRSSAG